VKEFGSIIMGYGFMLAGVAMGAFVSRKRLLSSQSIPRDPTVGLFLTGMWLGLILGGLGLVFHGSFWAGIITSLVLIMAAFSAKRAGRLKRGGQ
jgi:hypothetical protein